MFKKLIVSVGLLLTLLSSMGYALETVDEQILFLNSAGYSGSLRGMLLSYYNDQNGDISYSVEDAQYKFFIGEGYCCTLPDMVYRADTYFASGDTDYVTFNGQSVTFGGDSVTWQGN